MREGGIVAFRQYEVHLPDGTDASIAFTLGDPAHDSIPAHFARESEALAYGLVSIEGIPGAPEWPIVWTQTREVLGITVADDDAALSDNLRQIITRLIGVFFNDVKDIAPELGPRDQRRRK